MGYCFGGGSRAEWSAYDFNSKEDEDKFRSVSIELWETGRLHQPRKFGAHPSRRQNTGWKQYCLTVNLNLVRQ
jgi:hypothetical protein